MSSGKSENSLHGLTRRFLRLLDETPDKVIDLNTAAYLLNVGKRRVYDITNVLEGLGLLQKSHVNNVKWVGGDIKSYGSWVAEDSETSCTGSLGASDLGCDADDITEAERKTETEIAAAERSLDRLYEEIAQLSQSARNMANAYVTHDDLQGLDLLRDKLVFAVKTSENTKIEFAEKGLSRHVELNITSAGEGIEVFHVPNE